MYKWLLDQQITKLYSVHKQVPKQIKGTPKLENEFHRKQQYQAWSKITDFQLTDKGENVQKGTRIFSARRWFILVARKRQKKEKKIACPLLDVFAFNSIQISCGQVSSPRLYRLIIHFFCNRYRAKWWETFWVKKKCSHVMNLKIITKL